MTTLITHGSGRTSITDDRGTVTPTTADYLMAFTLLHERGSTPDMDAETEHYILAAEAARIRLAVTDLEG